ncbi:MAG: phospho-sugar mutase, partial [Clostridia bacterium]|nr:phospho-sugar mutase [Clostridia bacterium]
MYQQNFDKWFEADLPQVYHDELVAMADDENLKKEAFSMPLAFGTAGMRGVLGMGISRMNIYTVSRATEGLARLIESKGAQDRGVLIGYDTRHGSFLFATTTAKVLEQHGIKVYLYEDVRPVPQVSFGVRELGCIAGVMITASHNPKEYNGYKVYGEDGAQLDLEDSDTLTKIISGIEEYIGIPTSSTA